MTSRDAIEPTRTIAPPSSRIAANPFLQPRKWERRLTAMTRSQSSAVVPADPESGADPEVHDHAV